MAKESIMPASLFLLILMLIKPPINTKIRGYTGRICRKPIFICCRVETKNINITGRTININVFALS